jgi:hypothetical protein
MTAHTELAAALDESTLPANDDRPLSFGAALLGFVLSTAVTSTLMVLLSQA